MKNKILVTGGSGFIGTNFVSEYSSKNDIITIDIHKPRNKKLDAYHRQVDILDKSSLKKLIVEFQPTHILHLAARTDLDGKTLEDYNANIIGVKNIVEIANELPQIEKIIYASSRLVCPIGYEPKNDTDYAPNTLYGKSKVLGEEIVREFSLTKNWTIVRPTSIWGPWFGVPYNSFFNLLRKGLYIHPKNKKIYKSFGFVGNSIFQLDKLIHAESQDISEKLFYLCDYTPIEVSKWAEEIQSNFGVDKFKEVSPALLKFLARAGDILKSLGYQNPPLTSFRYNNICTNMIHTTDSLKLICGELPYSESEAIKITTRWIYENE